MNPIRIDLPGTLAFPQVNAYLFTEPEVVLVDAGINLDDCWSALVAALADHRLTPADINRVIVTHAHVDHYGQAARLAAEANAPIWISELGAPWIVESTPLWRDRLAYYRNTYLPRTGFSIETIEFSLATIAALDQLADLVPEAAIRTFGLNDTLTMGGQSWQVIYAPGHASMQTCFYQPKTGQLISADMLMPIAPAPVVEQPLDGRRERARSLPIYMRSLEKFEQLDVSMVYPGHGSPFDDHHEVISRQRDRILRRKAECLELIATGVDTAASLLAIMYAGRLPAMTLPGMWMLTGYLDLLLERHVIVMESIDGIDHYRIA